MHYTVLPLPTGKFIVAQARRNGEIVLVAGTPVAVCRDNISVAPRGEYSWKAWTYGASLFTSYRDAAGWIKEHGEEV